MVAAMVKVSDAASVVLAALIGAGAIPSARAEPEPRSTRELGGHRYIPSELVPWGFVTTRFAMTASAGFYRVDVRVPASVRELVRRRASAVSTEDFVAAAQSFRLDLAATPWLGLTARATGIAATGYDDLGALIVGVAASYEGEAGAIVRLVRSQTSQVSARADVGVSPTLRLVPGRVLETVVVDGSRVRFDPSPLVEREYAWWVRPAAALAWTATRRIGFQLGGAVELQRVDLDTDDREWTTTLAGGAGVSVDARPLALELAGAIEYEVDDESSAAEDLTFAFEPTDDLRGLIELGVYYADRAELDLGVAVTATLGNDDQRVVGSVRMAYTW